MSEIFGFYIYAAIIKLALIGAGAMSIFLGFRLFVAGVGTGEAGALQADARQLTLRLEQAAPGTCFALFGAALVASVAWNAAPSYEAERSPSHSGSDKLKMRGDVALNRIGEYAAALSNGALTLREAAPLLAGLAALLIELGERDAEAKAYAQLALTIDPANAPAVTAQAIALARLGECTDARDLLQKLQGMEYEKSRVNETRGAVDASCP